LNQRTELNTTAGVMVNLARLWIRYAAFSTPQPPVMYRNTGAFPVCSRDISRFLDPS